MPASLSINNHTDRANVSYAALSWGTASGRQQSF